MAKSIAGNISTGTRTFEISGTDVPPVQLFALSSTGSEARLQRQGGGRLLLLGDDRADVRGADLLEFLIDDPVR